MRKKILFPLLIASIMLLLAIFPINEYGYYLFLRWIVSLTALYIGYLFYKAKRTKLPWVMLIIAILFNPLIPIHFSKEIWFPIDILVAIIFITTIFRAKGEP